jgi:hypothetical protein
MRGARRAVAPAGIDLRERRRDLSAVIFRNIDP